MPPDLRPPEPLSAEALARQYAKGSYEQYVEWLPFAYRNRVVLGRSPTRSAMK